MTLKEWLKKHGRKQTWMAEQLGISVVHMSRVATGAVLPSRDLIYRIEDATEGAVTASSWREVAK